MKKKVVALGLAAVLVLGVAYAFAQGFDEGFVERHGMDGWVGVDPNLYHFGRDPSPFPLADNPFLARGSRASRRAVL